MSAVLQLDPDKFATTLQVLQQQEKHDEHAVQPAGLCSDSNIRILLSTFVLLEILNPDSSLSFHCNICENGGNNSLLFVWPQQVIKERQKIGQSHMKNFGRDYTSGWSYCAPNDMRMLPRQHVNGKQKRNRMHKRGHWREKPRKIQLPWTHHQPSCKGLLLWCWPVLDFICYIHLVCKSLAV